MTRLVHVTTTDISLELLLGPQLTAFVDAGYDVIALSAPGPHVEAVRARGVEHAALEHATRSMEPGQDVQALGELRRRFAELRPDVVHTHNPKPGVYGRLAARSAGVPVVVNTVHGLYAQPTDRWRRRLPVYALERLAATCSQAELVQNPEDLETMRRVLRVPSEKLVLLGNGIDLERFARPDDGGKRRRAVRDSLGIDPDAVVVGAVGRLVLEKGYAELFTAWEQVATAHPGAALVVVGPQDDSKADALDPDLVARARDAGVRFLGMRDDVEDLYPAMDLYVLASHREGFPRSAMEAAAAGLPVVATDIRGCRQVVEDGSTGLLVPVRSPGPLAVAIGRLVGDADLRASLGRAATAKARSEFDQRRVIDLTLRTYERLLERAGRAVPVGRHEHGADR
jgi:glycosyltransferase involved in cell wall biosynthesis